MNAWFSIARARISISQCAWPVTFVKCRRERDDAGAPHREDPVQLGEAQVVADGQPEWQAPVRLGEDDLVARVLGVSDSR